MAFVYILRCADGSLYIGSTHDVDSRVARHNRGAGCAFTATRCPVRLAYREEHPNMKVALARERQLKRWTRAKKEALISGDIATLKAL
jgi:putative endonuclease